MVVVEHFACVEELGKYWQYFVREMQYEPNLVQPEIDEPELVPACCTSKSAIAKTNTQKQNEFFFS